jgi:hypothetical protein
MRRRAEPDNPGTFLAKRRVIHPGAYRRMVLLQARDVSKSAKEAERLVGEGRCVEAQHKLLWAVGEMGDIGGSLYECSQEGCMTEEAESRLRLKMISDVADARTAVADKCLRGWSAMRRK